MRFTVRRPPTGEVSPCCHRPSGGDVSCSVDIGVAPSGIAGLALEDRLALAVFGCDMPASGTSLRRVRRRDLLDPTQSFMLQTSGQESPTAAADPPVEPTLLSDSHARLVSGSASRASHGTHLECLDPDHVEPPRNVSSGFLNPVPAPIPLAGFQFRNRPFRFFTTTGATFSPGEPLLQHSQPLRLTRSETGRVQHFASGQCSRDDHPSVNTNHTPIPWPAYGIRNVHKRHMPAASSIPGNPVGLDPVRNRTRQTKPHPSSFRHPDVAVTSIQPLDVSRLYRDLPKSFMYASFAPRWSAVGAAKEVCSRLREVAQCLLLHGLTSGTKPGILSAGVRQLRALLHVSGSLTSWLPVQVLLNRQIPDVSGVPTVRQQHVLLFRSRQQSEPRHSRTVNVTTDTFCRTASRRLQ